MTSYTKGTRKNKKSLKKSHGGQNEIKKSTSCAKHGRLTYSDPSLMKISSSSMRAISTVTNIFYILYKIFVNTFS